MITLYNQNKVIDLSNITSSNFEYVNGQLKLKAIGTIAQPAPVDLTGVTQTIYVDATTGNDTTGNGTSSQPYQTVQKAVSVAPTSGSAIYAKAGTYYANRTDTVSYGKGLYDEGKSIIFYGDAGKTIFIMDGVAHVLRDQYAISTTGTNTKIYDIIFDVRFNGRTNNYSKALFSNNSEGVKCVVYNCVFKCDSAPSFSYANSSTLATVYNSSFVVPTNFVQSYAGIITLLQNCATNYAFYAEGTRTTCLNNVTFDSDYKITSSGWKNTGTGTNYNGDVANIGVDGGQYNWTAQLPCYSTTAGEYEFDVIDMTKYAQTINNLQITKNIPDNTLIDIYTSTSSDGANFSPYAALNVDGTITSPQGRYLKIKIVVSAKISTISTTINDFQPSESSQFQVDDKLIFDGSLYMKTSYQYNQSNDVTWAETGKLFRKPLNEFNKVDKIEVI